MESLNILLAIRELGDNYLLPEKTIVDLFIEGRELSYFTIVSCLFYIKDEPRYDDLRGRLIEAVIQKLNDLSDIFMNSEKAYLFLDMLSCPFMPNQNKTKWLKALHKNLTIPLPPKTQLASFIANANSENWQVNWADVDLLNSLEKKELKQAY